MTKQLKEPDLKGIKFAEEMLGIDLIKKDGKPVDGVEVAQKPDGTPVIRIKMK